MTEFLPHEQKTASNRAILLCFIQGLIGVIICYVSLLISSPIWFLAGLAVIGLASIYPIASIIRQEVQEIRGSVDSDKE